MSDYPEHKKLKALGGANQIVGDFIEWLGEQDYVIAAWNASGTYCLPANVSRDKLIADHFEIDRDKLEAEKQAILDALRPTTPAEIVGIDAGMDG